MSYFFETADEGSMRLEDGHILRCRVQRINGEWDDSEIDLNCCIGNIDGRFEWGAENFSDSAVDIRLDIEAGQPILRAGLRTEEGQHEPRDINLTERIANRDGRLCFE